MPTVSVIVPVYNVEKYLCRCIDSILAQTFSDFELILVDDGSPDNCPTICDEYTHQDSRVRVIHQENGGVARARNAALDIAVGAYIAFCDSDDCWSPILLETVLAHFDKGCDCVSYQYAAVHENGDSHCSSFSVCNYHFRSWNEKMDFFVQEFQQYRIGWELWSKVFKRSIIEDHHIRICEACGNYAEDMDFVAKYLLCSNSIACIEDQLYNYYLREDSMMGQSEDIVRFDSLNEVSKDVCAFTQKNIPADLYQRFCGILHYFFMYNQYSELMFSRAYRTIPAELCKINDQVWFKENTRSTIRSKNDLIRLFGNEKMRQIIALSSFCLHKCWVLYAINRRVNYFLHKRSHYAHN